MAIAAAAGGVDKDAISLLQEDRADAFNRLVDGLGRSVNLSGGQFRGYDLRRFHLQKADLSGCYLRSADLRGLDLSEANLAGASLKDAKVSGTLFPKWFDAAELRMSLELGTRLRPNRES
jgi:uncharacterized protein YjbI with pentapeptide repeats